MQIQCLDKFRPLIERHKRVKIIVGGRGSTKSTFIADRVACGMSQGELWACGREFQNSIDESVHRLLSDEIGRLGLTNFSINARDIAHDSGGRSFYVGLQRNILSLKGTLSGIHALWIEEGEGLSEETLRVAPASVRTTAAEFDAARADGREITPPEIWISMNRRSREDPIAKRYLERAEAQLEACGFYEDDEVMIVVANYTDLPKAWWEASGLEVERASDERLMTTKQYNHKWLGHYIETIDNPLIHEEWFDACVDAHLKLGFEPTGAQVVSHDPSDLGADSKGLAYRHGSVILDVLEKCDGDVFEGCDWALDYAIQHHADLFVWDGDGLGAPLRERVEAKLRGKKIKWEMYKGSEGVEDPDLPYQSFQLDQDEEKIRTNKDVFANMRAQQYCKLRDKMRRTWEAVVLDKYHNPDDLISFSSNIKLLNKFKAELCRLPIKDSGNGKIQLMTKKEMAGPRYRIPSPNLADAGKMCLRSPTYKKAYKPVQNITW